MSQALVETGTVRLDAFSAVFSDYPYQIQRQGDHYYYYFPLGTSLIATPAVAMALLFGADMHIHDAYMQLVIATLVLMASYVLMQRIASFYINDCAGAIIAAAFFFGTSFSSTGSTALWSHNMAAMFALLAIYCVIADQYQPASWRWLILAISLFLAYLCRPTLALLAPVVLGVQLWLGHRKRMLATISVLAALIAGFVLFSWWEFGQLLPAYYLPQRLGGDTFWLALYGNLLSPARGILVYSPFLLLPLLVFWRLWQRLPDQRAALCLLLWPALHLVAISKFPHWWAGHSYGPRLMYDVLPAFFLVFVLYWSQLTLRSVMGVSTLIMLVWAISINALQPISNEYIKQWNAEPDVDVFPELLFDWRYPQFLHTKSRHEARLQEM